MASKRLEQETKLSRRDDPEPAMLQVATLLCTVGGCEFIWVTEDEDGDPIDDPVFCPVCGRRT